VTSITPARRAPASRRHVGPRGRDRPRELLRAGHGLDLAAPPRRERRQTSQKVETTSATFILRASKDADLVRNQAVLVRTEAMNGRAASQYVNLTVTD